MQVLARLYDAVLAGSGRTLTIVCATSAATPAGAAVEAFRGARHARIVVLFPHEGRISEVQRRFMTTTRRRQRAHRGRGGGDLRRLPAPGEGPVPPTRTFRDEAVDLSGVNSINWGAHRRPVRSTISPAAVALGAPHRQVRYVTCPPATSATPSPATPRGAWGSTSPGSPSRWHQRQRHPGPGRYPTGRYATRPGPRTPPARPWTSRSPPTSSGCISRPRAGTRWRPAAPLRPWPATRAKSTWRPQALAYMRDGFDRPCAVGEDETARTILSTLNETGELIDPHTAVGLAGDPAHDGRRLRRWWCWPPPIPPSSPTPCVRPPARSLPCTSTRAAVCSTAPERIDRLAADDIAALQRPISVASPAADACAAT